MQRAQQMSKEEFGDKTEAASTFMTAMQDITERLDDETLATSATLQLYQDIYFWNKDSFV